jgi:tight adherence protein B
LAAGVFGGFIVLITGSSPIVSLLAAFACGLGLPRFILARVIKRRQAKFLMPSTSSCAASSRVSRSPIACRS